MGRWHAVKSGRAEDGSENHKEFREAGRLFSVVNEASQNATDNRDPSIEGPVTIRFSLIEVRRGVLTRWLDSTWNEHVGSPKSRKSDLLKDRRDRQSPLIPGVDDSSPVRVLLIEDYGTTGLLGDPEQTDALYEADDENHTADTRDNLVLWFLRAEGITRQSDGRGGSRGLGKKANPLASEVATFFVVSARTGDVRPPRILAGQTNLVTHAVDRLDHHGVLSFGQDGLKDESQQWSWLPVIDASEIDRFCDDLHVDRPPHRAGTSLVIPIPISTSRDGPAITYDNIKSTILANWTIPIRRGIVEFDLRDTTQGRSRQEHIDAANVDKTIHAHDWSGLGDDRPARLSRSSAAREHTFKRLANQVIDITDNGSRAHITLTQHENTAADFKRLDIPPRLDPIIAGLRKRLLDGEVVTADIRVPVCDADGNWGRGRCVVALVANNTSDAAIRFQRGNLNIAKDGLDAAGYPGFSALCWIPDSQPRRDINLHELLRSCEGPAHVDFSARKTQASSRWLYAREGHKMVQLLPKQLLEYIIDSASEAEVAWPLFGGASEATAPELLVEPSECRRGFAIRKKPGVAAQVAGKRYLIRVGYPRPAEIDFGTRRPLPRDVDLPGQGRINATGCRHELIVDSIGAVPDRLRCVVESEQFRIEVIGLDSRILAGVVVVEEAAMPAVAPAGNAT